MKSSLLFVLFLSLYTVALQAQIGINKSNPAKALEVGGNTKMDGSLFLENPGENTEIRNSKLLITKNGGEIIKYDIDISKYGPVNYAQFNFRNVSTNGLQDYDTKISTADYLIGVQGYYFLEPVSGDTDVMTQSNTANDNIEGYQIYAYPNVSTGTWFLRAFINNGTFRVRTSNNNGFMDSPVDLFLNLIIYRRGFITKEQTPMTIDMGDSETITAPLPPGF